MKKPVKKSTRKSTKKVVKKRTAKKPTARKATTKARVQKKLKPKFRIGEFVYSYHNPTEKRQINAIRVSKKFGVAHKYRLTLSDQQSKPKKSVWIDEKSLSKRKTSH